MVASVLGTKDYGIADVGVRRGVRGVLILQVRRYYRFCRSTPTGYEPDGMVHKSDWKDVNGNDLKAVQEAMNLLDKLSVPPLPPSNPHVL